MENTGKLRRTLKLWHIVLIGVGYMTPMVVFDTFGIVSEVTGGHVPTGYILALIAMLFTAASYGQMVRAFPIAGSAYTYAQKAISKHLGFLVGWAVLLDYLFLPMVNALLARIYLSALFPDVPSWIWVVAFTLLVTGINLFTVKTMANFNTILVACQITIMAVFTYLAIQGIMAGEGYGQLFTIQPLYSPDMELSALLAGATILCFSFLGFDAVTTLSEETPEPTKTIPRAIFLVALIGGILFITESYFIQAFFPDNSRFVDPGAASPEIALMVGGAMFQIFFLAATLTGVIASGITSHASVARLLYVMGRDNVFPKKFFGYVSPRWGSPALNVLLVGAICLLAIFLDLATVIALINFGALTAFTFVNLSVIAHYAVRKKMYTTFAGFLKYVLFPTTGAIFVGVLWWNLESSSLTLGLIWLTIGVAYLVYLTKGFRVPPPQFDHVES